MKGLYLCDFCGSLKKARVTDDKVRAPRFFRHNPQNSSQIFRLCQQSEKPQIPCIANVAQIFAAIACEREKCENKMLYSTSYNEWFKKKQLKGKNDENTTNRQGNF